MMIHIESMQVHLKKTKGIFWSQKNTKNFRTHATCKESQMNNNIIEIIFINFFEFEKISVILVKLIMNYT